MTSSRDVLSCGVFPTQCRGESPPHGLTSIFAALEYKGGPLRKSQRPRRRTKPMQEVLAIAFFGLAAVIYYVQVSR